MCKVLSILKGWKQMIISKAHIFQITRKLQQCNSIRKNFDGKVQDCQQIKLHNDFWS